MMANLYGEILPVLSRAVDDEDENFTPRVRTLEFHWQSGTQREEKVKANSLVVGIGSVASCFLEANFGLGEESLLGVMQELDDDEEDQYEAVSKMNTPISTFYKQSVADRVFVTVTCRQGVSAEQIWPWNNELFNRIQPTGDVIVLTSAPVHELKCDGHDRLQPPIIRSLTTSIKPQNHPVFPSLETPNMLKDIPAAVITYCEVHKIPAVVYACYTENFSLDVSSVQAFTSLLQTMQFPSLEVTKHVARLTFQSVGQSQGISNQLHQETALVQQKILYICKNMKKENALRRIQDLVRNDGSVSSLYI